MRRIQAIICAAFVLVVSTANATAQHSTRASRYAGAIPAGVLLRIIRAEDERRWNDDLSALLADQDAQVRRRAALAAGRIGDERAVPWLAEMVLTDRDVDVRQRATFALGEIESPGGAYALTSVLQNTHAPGRARAVEALGKITAALASSAPAVTDPSPAIKPADDRLDIFKAAILDALRFEAGRHSAADRLTILLGLTAALRAKPEASGQLIAQFLSFSDPRIRADALNTLSRLKFKDGNEQARKLLIADPDPIVRANAARVLGATEDKAAFGALLDRATKDADLRVRVSAIGALGSLKDPRAGQPLFDRASRLILDLRNHRPVLDAMQRGVPPSLQNEWLETATTLGNILAGQPASAAIKPPDDPVPPQFAAWYKRHEVRELEIAAAKSEPGKFVRNIEEYFLKTRNLRSRNGFFADWRRVTSVAQALGIIATTPLRAEDGDPKPRAQKLLLEMINDRRLSALALPDALTAYAAFKPDSLSAVLQGVLGNSDVIARAAAAELMGNQSPNEANSRALIDSLKIELPRIAKGEMNDAALAILDALGKQKSAAANDAIKTALNSSDHLLRRKAVALLKANGAGDFSSRIGTVKTRNTAADYRRAIARIGKQVRATVVTSKGSFVIEFLPEDAPLTVDNFVQLARKGFFNGQTIPRVVPNFVVQAGDPRGDQNGGPGYQIRCEINEVPYERGAVGMALSGKDTGGSQWFVTHSPQPHLDGGYTVFARVISGMEVVDKIARGDIIRRVTVNEGQY